MPSPRYRRNHVGQAIVRIDGHEIVLGEYGSQESYRELRRVVAEWHSGVLVAPEPMTLEELADRFQVWAADYYRQRGEPTQEQVKIDVSLRPLRELYGHTLATTFGPQALRAVRDRMVRAGLSRSTINLRTSVIRRLFRWAESRDLVDPGTFESLKTVEGLKVGRSRARESDPVMPVSRNHIAATLPHLPRVVADMVRVQLRSGMRPGEVLSIRSLDLHETSSDVWVYRPLWHKTAYLGRPREVWLGPRAQAILRRYIDRTASPGDFLFRTELAPRTNVTGAYRVDSYRRAVRRACLKAEVPIWSPNQLRHTAATEIRRRFGLEAARVVLGHTSPRVTEVYAEIDSDRARHIMRQSG